MSEYLNMDNYEMPKKKKKKTGKIILIILLSLLAFLILLVGIAFFAVNHFINDTLDYISYVSEGEEQSWEGVDIDGSEYYDDYDMGIDTSNFVDPEADRDESSSGSGDATGDGGTGENGESGGSGGNGGGGGSGGNGGGGGNNYTPPPEPPYEPDYEIIEGLFDGENISDEYKKDVINILLIGADTVSGKYARSDTIILMSINNLKNRIVFTSFMRDTYVAIPGYQNNRINAAYAAGGPSLLIKTIELNFGVDIDYYFTVSISAFEQAVDVIGGIDITVNSTNYNYFKTFSQVSGLTKEQAIDGSHVIHLNGGSALGYARSRNFYDGDFTRTMHQRDLLTQFVNNCKGKSLSQLHELLKSVLPYVVTNMPKATLKSMIWSAVTYVSYDVTDARVPCAGSFNFANIRGMEVLTINFPSNQKYIKAKIYG